MIKETRPAYYAASRSAEYCGKSTDALPAGIENGDEFYAIDEGKWYVYDGSTGTLVENTSRNTPGSATDISLGITGGKVGEIIKIASVDENGAPTSWDTDTAISANDGVTVPLLLSQYGMDGAFRIFCNSEVGTDTLSNVVERFFKAASATVEGVYGSQFYLYDVSPSSVGTKLLANINLVCKPSTNATAGQDDYKALPLFACYDVNYTIDSTTLEPVIHAVKGIYGNFDKAPGDSLVGVIQMTGWVKRFKDDTNKTIYYAAYNQDGTYRPLPEAVKVDNTVRSYVLHAKYAAGFNKNGKLSSVSGVQTLSNRPGSAYTANISHDGQIALWREWGNQYCGSSMLDIAFVQTMLEIKYASLSIRGIE